ncbi:NAD-dependent histone deacetylase SIR2 [Cryptococcus wingfieldii CBS 7118]|uniref:NAD-dependent histone deacetylase SIR2 n=1 Tax=Cryptococcus wingfieldii CBS 7118 TaxID=1295528 RepID=A0A1E3IGM0_9TREE|nr:NAD-dependent histone deacetylase SIR2 [Cryptococcus wingfieldii CBS 7118]ODN87740.1 NAD-dependent histone deacetylase SIR2 [Cryptococcus wingfieldii CBS 7118]
MSEGSTETPQVKPADTYQIDSDEYDSDQARDELSEVEYDKLVEEAENGYNSEEMDDFTHQLKETGIVNFLRSYLVPDASGEMRSLRKLLLGFGIIPPLPLCTPSTSNLALLPFAKVTLSRILRRRSRLPDLFSLSDALDLLKNAKKIIVLSGAGISTSCGIPDFRSSTGLYAQLQNEGKYELDDPQQMFDIRYFREKPEVFYSFAKQIYPSNFVPSPCHRWIKMLEDRGVLLRNYTQNIDTLESLAGVSKVLQCHGSFKTASCLRCKTRHPGRFIEPHIMAQTIPYCEPCKAQCAQEHAVRKTYKEQLKKLKAKANGKGKGKASAWEQEESGDESGDEWGGGEPGIIKPDITFFGQALDSEFDECLFKDREEVDLLVVIGTSLKVAPVSEVLTHIPHSVPQIFINLTPAYHVQPDISLLGDADSIVTYISDRLGWSIPSPSALPAPKSEAEDAKRRVERESPTPGQKDEEKMKKASHVSIPPEEAEWLEVDDERHFHLLRRKGDPLLTRPLVDVSDEDPSTSPSVQAETNGPSSVPPSVPTSVPTSVPFSQAAAEDAIMSSLGHVPTALGNDIEEGYASDEESEGEERPVKKMKRQESD